MIIDGVNHGNTPEEKDEEIKLNEDILFHVMPHLSASQLLRAKSFAYEARQWAYAELFKRQDKESFRMQVNHIAYWLLVRPEVIKRISNNLSEKETWLFRLRKMLQHKNANTSDTLMCLMIGELTGQHFDYLPADHGLYRGRRNSICILTNKSARHDDFINFCGKRYPLEVLALLDKAVMPNGFPKLYKSLNEQAKIAFLSKIPGYVQNIFERIGSHCALELGSYLLFEIAEYFSAEDFNHVVNILQDADYSDTYHREHASLVICIMRVARGECKIQELIDEIYDANKVLPPLASSLSNDVEGTNWLFKRAHKTTHAIILKRLMPIIETYFEGEHDEEEKKRAARHLRELIPFLQTRNVNTILEILSSTDPEHFLSENVTWYSNLISACKSMLMTARGLLFIKSFGSMLMLYQTILLIK